MSGFSPIQEVSRLFSGVIRGGFESISKWPRYRGGLISGILAEQFQVFVYIENGLVSQSEYIDKL